MQCVYVTSNLFLHIHKYNLITHYILLITVFCTIYDIRYTNYLYCNKVNITPAATAVPITPATLGPMACINKKLLGFAS